MKIKALLSLLLILYSLNVFSQNKRLNFIILIDNEIPKTNIVEGRFIVKDSMGTRKDSINFKYQVGGLIIDSSDYKKLLPQNLKSKVVIKFDYSTLPDLAVNEYKYEIPSEWLNEVYMIVRVYNYSNEESRRKYYFRKKNGYKIIFESPLGGNAIAENER
jgi:hypothetical protein